MSSSGIFKQTDNCHIGIIVKNCSHDDKDFIPLLFKSLLLFVVVVVRLAFLEQFKPGRPIKDNQMVFCVYLTSLVTKGLSEKGLHILLKKKESEMVIFGILNFLSPFWGHELVQTL